MATDKISIGTKAEKLVAAGVVFRERKKGVIEWFYIKTDATNQFELPKTDVRRGESSVQAVIRHLKENGGLRVTVLEEAGRANVTTKKSGEAREEKILYYLMQHKMGNEADIRIEGQWGILANVKKKLATSREQKILTSANTEYKEWLKKKKLKKQ